MKNLLKQSVLILTLAGTMPAMVHATGIPTVDGAAVGQRQLAITQTMQQWAKEGKQWMDTVKHYKTEVQAYADQLASQTGVRDVKAFIGDAQSLYQDVNDLKSEFSPVLDLVNGGKDALNGKAKALFEKYNLFDRCQNLRAAEIKSCEANIVSTVESMTFLDSVEKGVNNKLKTIDKLAKRMANSKDVKESQDLKNAMDIQLASLQTTQVQIELFNKRQADFRRLMQDQKQQLMSERRLNPKGGIY
ncbi:type IV secretion system protein [Aggregatibacter actinomycetemcomitans]|uniref:type IV secretion system protein n=1 Tax=Aggregatibacter actinomycetemcomitans TaxID=714 RepID=UPI00197B731B|nr:type IV secretion system protein [Aggregatibacter actinomycetemcomitans]MBN6059387.1 type IV secretion system protein [Aggregatibacter actinomycetemcomitans]MBN6087888.1 type IV secretion system protein [Aggregatibacter actinomycetemcomitans]